MILFPIGIRAIFILSRSPVDQSVGISRIIERKSEPFEDLGTESPESPHTVASPTSLPNSTPRVCHVEESEGSDTSGVRSTSSDSTAPLSPDHPFTHATPVLILSLCRTVRMAMRVPPVMSSSLSASITKVAAMSDSAFNSEEDELGEDKDEEIKDSSDPSSESEDAEDEGPTAGDEDFGMRVESFGLGGDEAVPEGQHRAAPVVETALGEPLGLGYGVLRHRGLAAEEDQKYSMFEVGQGSGSVPEGAERESTPPSPEWSSDSLPISPTPSTVPSPISSPTIPLTVPSHVTTPTVTIPVDEDQSLEHEQERTAMTFRALWRLVLALKAWAGHVDTRMANMSWAGYDDHRLVHDLLVQQAALQRELQEMRGRVTAFKAGEGL
nr:hypothetical protein [Tanacetum cinerariifolium]